jgi:hypothetical protein
MTVKELIANHPEVALKIFELGYTCAGTDDGRAWDSYHEKPGSMVAGIKQMEKEQVTTTKA